MEDKKITEQESLELIASMIRQTKNHLNIGSGNTFLIWGYTCVLVSLLVYTICMLTGSGMFSLLYLGIPIIGLSLQIYTDKKNIAKHGTAKNYTTKVIDRVWDMVGYTFAIAGGVAGIYYLIFGTLNFSLFFLLGFLMPAFGCAVTGNVVKEACLKLGGYFGIACALAMCYHVMAGHHITVEWCLVFALCFIFMMVIPGHYLNYKARKEQL